MFFECERDLRELNTFCFASFSHFVSFMIACIFVYFLINSFWVIMLNVYGRGGLVSRTSLNNSGPPRVVGRNGKIRCCTEECGHTYRNTNCGLSADLENAPTGYLN